MEQGNVEEFNLDEFLHGMSTQAQAAGHKPKHLGLIWKDLMVEVLPRIPLFVFLVTHGYSGTV